MLRRLRDESGMALVFALMTMSVMSLVAGTAIYYSTAGQHDSTVSKSSDLSYRLAESGLNNALKTMFASTMSFT